MFQFWPIYKRELKTFFQSPSTYVVLALFFLIAGMIFHEMMGGFSRMSQNAGMNMFGGGTPEPNVTEMVVRPIFNLMSSLIMFTIPLLSMRLVAEEKSRGTFELLVTCPIGDWSILVGKYLALLTVGLVIVALSALFPYTIAWAGKANQVSPEWPVVISCWIGLILIFAVYAAFGLMASAFTENQMTAGVITLIGLILWNVVGFFQLENLPKVKAVLQELSAGGHTDNFIKGVLMPKDFAFYILASFVCLFIASKTLDARRWRI